MIGTDLDFGKWLKQAVSMWYTLDALIQYWLFLGREGAKWCESGNEMQEEHLPYHQAYC